MQHSSSSTATALVESKPAWSLVTVLKLGRISNLPTVWTNSLLAVLLCATQADWSGAAALALAMSCAYVGGMYLNDAFDRHIDQTERPERPIPSGSISALQVFIAGYTLLALAIALTMTASTNFYGVGACLALCGSIVLYNIWHKGNPISPVIMGICRCLVYLTCALSVSASLNSAILICSLVLFCYLIGLTYAAKQEHISKVNSLWPLILMASPIVAFLALSDDLNPLTLIAVLVFSGWVLYALILLTRQRIGNAVSSMIAGICLLDGLMICLFLDMQESYSPAFIGTVWLSCAAACLLTRGLQRVIPGT